MNVDGESLIHKGDLSSPTQNHPTVRSPYRPDSTSLFRFLILLEDDDVDVAFFLDRFLLFFLT